MPLRTGKLPPSVLQSLVLSRLGVSRADVLVHAALGEDSTVIDFGEWVCVVSTDPITGAGRNAGWLAVHISCNDVAANGAEPVGVLPTLLLPEEATEEDIRRTMGEISAAALELGVEVLGGHTEVTPALPSLIISLTAIGRARKDSYVTSAGARPGDDILMSKWAALEGTSILANDFAALLEPRLGPECLERAQNLVRQISVVREGLLAARNGATALHDATEGGILGALYEMAEASGIGVEIWPESIPMLPDTRDICEVFGVDPLRLISSGTMLIASPRGPELVELLARNGIKATVFAKALPASAGRWLVHGDGRREPLAPPERDELWRILEERT
ncbi:MAG: AIR synthase family protein [Chloroflexota bacterium]